MKVKITRTAGGLVTGICEACNKSVSVATIGGLKCAHGVVIHKHNTDNVSIVEVKMEDPKK